MTSQNEIRAALKGSIVDGFFRHGVALVNVSEPFRLASGALSPVYLDHRRIFSVPGLREQVASLWADMLRERLAAPCVIAGTATAGIAPAYALAAQLGYPFVYVRGKPKDHGLGRMVEGVWSPGSDVVVVDDMVTTGGSVLEAAARLREEGGKPLLATSITRHDFDKTRLRFDQANLELLSCFTSRELFALGEKGGHLSPADLEAVTAWLDAHQRGTP